MKYKIGLKDLFFFKFITFNKMAIINIKNSKTNLIKWSYQLTKIIICLIF